MTCTKGQTGWRGTVTIVAPQLAGHYSTAFVQPSGKRSARFEVACSGPCGGVVSGGARLELSGTGLSATERADEHIPILVERTCQGRKLPPLRLSIAFDEIGRVDVAKSKLH